LIVNEYQHRCSEMDYTDLLEFLKLAAYLLPIFLIAYLLPIFLIVFAPIVILQSFRVIRFYRDPELRSKYKLYSVFANLGLHRDWKPFLTIILVQVFWIVIVVAIFK